jgi:quinol monooxygenase YgiN
VCEPGGPFIMAEDPQLAVLTARFDPMPGSEQPLMAVLARYVVVTRQDPACRNIDLLASPSRPGRLLVVEKWASTADARAHLDSAEMTAMAEAAVGHLATRPEVDLYDTISAHDLH